MTFISRLMQSLLTRWHLGPLRYSYQNWDVGYARFNKFPANHFIATMERQCVEFREIEKNHVRLSKTARAEYAKEAADCISVAVNFLRRVTDGSPEAVAAAIKGRASRYADPHAIMDHYIANYGA